MKEIIEVKIGKVKLIKSNVLLENITDMIELEFWEDRLRLLNNPYAITFKEYKGRVYYKIYTNIKTKGSPFRVTNE